MQIKNYSVNLLFILFGFLLSAQDTSLYEKKVFIKDGDSLKYRVLYPGNFDKDSSYPVVLFLHGAGERGNDNEKQLTHGSSLFTKVSNRNDFPAIVIFPQCPIEDYWANVIVDRSTNPLGLQFQYAKGPTKSMNLVIELLKENLSQNYTNKDQVYIMGLSMGGMGTFELLYRKPDVFAAAIPICGAGEPESVSEYAGSVPLWVFHGSRDNVVAPQQSLQMVSAILDNGGFPKLTWYEDANHNSWDSAFTEPELLKWLFSHKKNKK